MNTRSGSLRELSSIWRLGNEIGNAMTLAGKTLQDARALAE